MSHRDFTQDVGNDDLRKRPLDQFDGYQFPGLPGLVQQCHSRATLPQRLDELELIPEPYVSLIRCSGVFS